MQFLSPWTALLAAAVALPLLLLLYFLKLRRQTLRIPSTLLWRKSFEDLQVNAPFQRLRWSLLLLLQLLMLAALLLALAEPLWRTAGPATASRVVLVIDRSASMNAPVADDPDDPERPPMTRLEAAKVAAREIIDTIGERGRAGPSQVMLIAFGASAQVVSTFESNRGVLRDALDAITPSDEQSDLESALELASAFAASRDEDAEAGPPPQVMLLSDGNVAVAGDRSTYSLRGGEFRFMQVARPSGAIDTSLDNLGIVALGARRDYDDPARVIIFARLLNAGPQPIDAITTLSIDGKPATTIRSKVPAAAAQVDGTMGSAGEAALSHALDLPGGAVITLRHNHADQLAADDIAAIVVPPPSKPRIALVFPADSRPDPFLYELLQAMEPQSVQSISAADWASIDPATIDDGSRFDLVVFDRVSGARLPGAPSLTFGGVPAGLQAHEPRSDGGQMILSWDRQHPILRNLSLDSIVFSGFGGFDLPEATATPLAWGPDGPIIALVRTRGARHIVVGFAPAKSNWPLHVSSAMFVQNAMEFLTLASSGAAASATSGAAGGAGIVHRPGEPISVRAAPDARSIIIEASGGSLEVPLPLIDAASPGTRLATLPTIPRAGLYTARGALPPNNVLAVSVLSDVESDIRPRDSVTVNAQASEALAGERERPMPLWPWLLAAALALAVLEWLAYCRRAW